MNNNLIIIILVILIILIILFLINNNFKEKFICINPEKIDTDNICDSSFIIFNNKNFLNNNITNGYFKIDYESNDRFKHKGTDYYKCKDNWDGTLNDFNKVHPDNFDKKQFYNKLKQEYPTYNFSNLELYKCNKTCPQGKGIIDNTNTCLDCPDKKYNTGDSHLCKNIPECPSNYTLINYDKKTGYINCKINSRPGYYYDNDTLSEKPCPIGKYNNTYGNTKCIDVSDGYYVDLTGQTTQKPHLVTRCGPGKKLIPATKTKDGECVDCPSNTYKTDYNSSISCTPYSKTECDAGKKLIPGDKTKDGECVDCPSNTYKTDTNSSISCTPHSITNCGPGKKLTPGTKTKDGICNDCPDGRYKTGNNSSTSCYPYSITKCVAGKKLIPGDKTKNGECVDCPPGHYSDGVTCTRVKAGYKLKEDKSGEEPCPVGTFSTYGSGQCSECPDGKYQDEEGKNSCKDYKSCSSIQKKVGGSKTEDKTCIDIEQKRKQWIFDVPDEKESIGIISYCNNQRWYRWKCPKGIYKISVLVVGAGGAGAKNGGGGGAGSLMWVNNLEVEPDKIYNVLVANNTTQIKDTNGQSRYFIGDGEDAAETSISDSNYKWRIEAYGAEGGRVTPKLSWGEPSSAEGGTCWFTKDNIKHGNFGGNYHMRGAQCGLVKNTKTGKWTGGGGGSGHYGPIYTHARSGGAFGRELANAENQHEDTAHSDMNGWPGKDGGGGGGTHYNNELHACGGGGIGIYGKGQTGVGGRRLPGTKIAAGGKGGSGGDDAVDEHGGLYGGGGAGGPNPGKGAKGVVRIIYTPDESAQFPNVNVNNGYFEEKETYKNEGLVTSFRQQCKDDFGITY